jgi:hypothetical protein
VREHGGPIREESPDQHPARYMGTTDGKRMTLTVVFRRPQQIGPFELVLGGSRTC